MTLELTLDEAYVLLYDSFVNNCDVAKQLYSELNTVEEIDKYIALSKTALDVQRRLLDILGELRKIRLLATVG